MLIAFVPGVTWQGPDAPPQPVQQQTQPVQQAAEEEEEDLGSVEVASFVKELLQETALEITEDGCDFKPRVHFLPGLRMPPGGCKPFILRFALLRAPRIF